MTAVVVPVRPAESSRLSVVLVSFRKGLRCSAGQNSPLFSAIEVGRDSHGAIERSSWP